MWTRFLNSSLEYQINTGTSELGIIISITDRGKYSIYTE